MPEFITVLGFDYGQRRIGLAVGQTLTHTATPLTEILNVADEPDWNAIAKYIQEFEPQVLVVGLPLKSDDSATAMTKRAKRFAKELKERFTLPVELVNELLSTREAKSRLMEAGKTRYSKKELNSTAAQVIVETYLSLAVDQSNSETSSEFDW